MNTRTISGTINELAELSKNNEKDSKHFAKLAYFMRQTDFAAAHAITKGRAEQGFFKSAYQKKLQELEPLIAPLPPQEAENRLYGLIYAVYNNEAEQIQQLLEDGSVQVINARAERDDEARDVSKGETPLLAALITEDIETIVLVMKYWANLDNVEDVNEILTDDGETALHIACRLNLPDIVVMLLEKGASVDPVRNDGATPLFLACLNGADEVARLLLNKEANPNIGLRVKNKDVKMTPFIAALGNTRLANDVLQYGYKVEPYDLLAAKKKNKDVYDLLRASARIRKAGIMLGHTLKEFAEEKQMAASPLDALFDRIYVEDEKIKKYLIDNLNALYHDKNTVLRPLLDLAVLAAAGKLPAKGKVQKPLKVIVVDDKSLNPLTADKETVRGLYKGKNTVYVSSVHSQGAVLATLLHELKHYADIHVYDDFIKPFRDNQKQHFMAVKNAIKEKVSELRVMTAEELMTEGYDKSDIENYMRLDIFQHYDKDKQDAEIMVKVPEIIGLRGMEDGYKWLKQHGHSLLAFYEYRFNRTCQAFLDGVNQPQAVQDTQPPRANY